MNIAGITDALISHAAATGYFERLNGHEPKNRNAVGPGLTASIWLQALAPVKASGLASTSGRLEYTLRIYTPMTAEPQDGIDPAVLAAADAMFAAYSGDFTLGGLVRFVDLLGAHGTPLSAQAGYLDLSGVMYRVFDLTVPLIINDLWNQEA